MRSKTITKIHRSRPFEIQKDSEVTFSDIDRGSFPSILRIPGLWEMVMRSARNEPVNFVISYDTPFPDGKKPIIDAVPSRYNTEQEISDKEALDRIMDRLPRLKAHNEKLYNLLLKRMNGESLMSIGKEAGHCYESARQTQEAAGAFLLLDPVIREIVYELDFEKGNRFTEKCIAIDLLVSLGFSEDFILKWIQLPGLPQFPKLKAASIAIAEAVYPKCTFSAKIIPEGQDRLDKEMVRTKLESLIPVLINNLCRQFDDLNKLADAVFEYVLKKIEKEPSFYKLRKQIQRSQAEA